MLKNGFEGDTFINGLAQHLRNLMYCKQEATQSLLQMSAKLRQKYLDQSTAIPYSLILTALNLCNKCDLEYPRAKEKRLHVEITLLKICYGLRSHSPIASHPIDAQNNPEKKTQIDMPKAF